MKQLSIFIIILFLNIMVHKCSLLKSTEYETPQIIKRGNDSSQVPKESDKEKLNKLKSKILEQEENFNPEKLLKWIANVEKLDIINMTKEELSHNIEGVRLASNKVKNYLAHTTRVIESSINLIDLKVNEIETIDKKISALKPSYKVELEKIKVESGSLPKALENEKQAVKKILEKINEQSNSFNKLNEKTKKIHSKINKLEVVKSVKDSVNRKLVPFMKLDYFEQAHKKINNIVEKRLKELFKKDGSVVLNADKLSNDILESSWKDILEKEEYNFKNKVESNKQEDKAEEEKVVRRNENEEKKVDEKNEENKRVQDEEKKDEQNEENAMDIVEEEDVEDFAELNKHYSQYKEKLAKRKSKDIEKEINIENEYENQIEEESRDNIEKKADEVKEKSSRLNKSKEEDEVEEVNENEEDQ